MCICTSLPHIDKCTYEIGICLTRSSSLESHCCAVLQVMVFFSSCNSVKYHAELLNYIDIPVTDIHGKQKQQRRTTAYFDFCQAEKGILLCTDVAARGLDIPAVDWIIQYDPPDDPKEYIHRVGRTARGKSGKGRALLLLLPEELGFLSYLKVSRQLWLHGGFAVSLTGVQTVH